MAIYKAKNDQKICLKVIKNQMFSIKINWYMLFCGKCENVIRFLSNEWIFEQNAFSFDKCAASFNKISALTLTMFELCLQCWQLV